MRAWFIGLGPSLANVDISRIPKQDLVVACNRIHLCKPEAWAAGWRPDVYLAVDMARNPGFFDDLQVHMEDGYPCFITSTILHERQEYQWWRHRNLRPFVACDHDDMEHRPAAAWHLPHLCCFGGPANVFAQIAVQDYRADQLFFLGCDLGYKASEGDPMNHCIPNYLPDRSYPPDGVAHLVRNRSLLAAHKLIQQETSWRGVECFNAAPGGELEVYPRVPFEELI